MSSAPAPSPMLATLGDDIADESEWAFEMKWDGIRAIATVDAGRVRLTSRSGRDMSPSYPDLAELGALIGGDRAVLDGEIVALNKRGRPDFGLLQSRMNVTKPADVARAVRAVPVHFMIFDLLEWNGESLTSRGYSERRHALEQRVTPSESSRIQLPPAYSGSLRGAIRKSKELQLEGIVAKRRDGKYATGRRSRSWIKIKHRRTQEVVIGGWRPGTGRRAETIGSLLVAVPDDSGLHYAGRVGTGFSDHELEEIRHTLARRRRQTSAMRDVPTADARDAHWVRPDLVGEVEFAEWTSTGRLRQPSWRGWRPDKSPDEVRRE